VAAISMILLRINLPNFVQLNSIKANQDHDAPRVIVFKAIFFSFYYCEKH